MKVGWISYWNLHPLRVELCRFLGNELQIEEAESPAIVNKWLLNGNVLSAPASSVCLLHSQMKIAAPVGVCSQGAVESVYLGYQKPLENLVANLKQHHAELSRFCYQVLTVTNDIQRAADVLWNYSRVAPLALVSPTIYLTPASATSVALTQVLYRLWFGTEVFPAQSRQKSDFELLIGDEALINRERFHGVLDLGQLWRELTDLPFVYAVWQSTRSLGTNWRNDICQVAEFAQMKMQIEPLDYIKNAKKQPHRKLNLPIYWKGIGYRLGAREMKGLLFFLSLASLCNNEQSHLKVLQLLEQRCQMQFGIDPRI